MKRGSFPPSVTEPILSAPGDPDVFAGFAAGLARDDTVVFLDGIEGLSYALQGNPVTRIVLPGHSLGH
jgi:hypothetical protein